jgi:hypothetical protein
MKLILTKDSLIHQLDSGHYLVGTELHLNEDGVLHRLDGPAVVFTDGSEKWYKNGELHRDDGPAWSSPNGTKEWFKEGNRHRIGGPALICPKEFSAWYENNVLHRIDGPAYMFSNGQKAWWIKGTHLTAGSPQDLKWEMLKGDPEAFEAFDHALTREMKEYICQTRPDLIGNIPDLGKELKAKYQHEVTLSKVDL